METIDKIRKNLYSTGYTNRDISVSCRGGSIINVKTKNSNIPFNWTRKRVAEAYYQDKHFWLIVQVDGQMLPLNGRYTI